MVYPFLPTFARQLGVDLQTIALAVTARSSLGLFGPVLGSFGDILGRKLGMLLGLSVSIVGMIPVVVWPSYPTFLIALLTGAAARIIFDPSMYAFLGDRVQYSRRGLAIATTEFGWSGAALIGFPFVGWLIASQSWIAPFPLLLLLGLGAMVAIWRLLPSDRIGASQRLSLLSGARQILTNRSALSILALVFLMSVGNEAVNIIYGAWLEDAFSLKIVVLGITAALIGLAELGGELGVARLTDRLGKWRAIGLGLITTLLAALFLPLLGQTLGGAAFGLFLFFITFEFTVVSALALITELMPSARATLLAATFTVAAGGRAIGALIGPSLFAFGILATCIFTAGTSLAAYAVVRRFKDVE